MSFCRLSSLHLQHFPMVSSLQVSIRYNGPRSLMAFWMHVLPGSPGQCLIFVLHANPHLEPLSTEPYAPQVKVECQSSRASAIVRTEGMLRGARNWASRMTHDEDRRINKQFWFIPDFVFPPREARGSSEPDFKLKEILSLCCCLSLTQTVFLTRIPNT